jgi:hypothetical protein
MSQARHWVSAELQAVCSELTVFGVRLRNKRFEQEEFFDEYGGGKRPRLIALAEIPTTGREYSGEAQLLLPAFPLAARGR